MLLMPQVYSSSSWFMDWSYGSYDTHTHTLIKFSTYIPCPRNRKIIDGSPLTITRQGTINLTLFLSLKHVLHVPKLNTNLVSIHQITKDLKCKWLSFPNIVFFKIMIREGWLDFLGKKWVLLSWIFEWKKG